MCVLACVLSVCAVESLTLTGTLPPTHACLSVCLSLRLSVSRLSLCLSLFLSPPRSRLCTQISGLVPGGAITVGFRRQEYFPCDAELEKSLKIPTATVTDLACSYGSGTLAAGCSQTELKLPPHITASLLRARQRERALDGAPSGTAAAAAAAGGGGGGGTAASTVVNQGDFVQVLSLIHI